MADSALKAKKQQEGLGTEIAQLAEQKLGLDKGAAKVLADRNLDGSTKGFRECWYCG